MQHLSEWHAFNPRDRQTYPKEASWERLAPDAYAAYKELVGKRVVASGTLFGAITGHHHTPVLLTVRTLSAMNP
jgi:hypothetical protein